MGLQHFDKLIQIAGSKGVKLIVTLTNNWADCRLQNIIVFVNWTDFVGFQLEEWMSTQ
jgi:hypothetical protein